MLSQVDAGRWDHVAGVLPWTDREWYRAGVRYGASYGRAASDGIHGSCSFLETLRFFITHVILTQRRIYEPPGTKAWPVQHLSNFNWDRIHV
jgi:hypothetical protein